MGRRGLGGICCLPNLLQWPSPGEEDQGLPDPVMPHPSEGADTQQRPLPGSPQPNILSISPLSLPFPRGGEWVSPASASRSGMGVGKRSELHSSGVKRRIPRNESYTCYHVKISAPPSVQRQCLQTATGRNTQAESRLSAQRDTLRFLETPHTAAHTLLYRRLHEVSLSWLTRTLPLSENSAPRSSGFPDATTAFGKGLGAECPALLQASGILSLPRGRRGFRKEPWAAGQQAAPGKQNLRSSSFHADGVSWTLETKIPSESTSRAPHLT